MPSLKPLTLRLVIDIILHCSLCKWDDEKALWIKRKDVDILQSQSRSSFQKSFNLQIVIPHNLTNIVLKTCNRCGTPIPDPLQCKEGSVEGEAFIYF